jgi:hypothetical protein
MEYVNLVLKTLVELWLFDVDVFSSKWLYIPFCIPAMFYMMFFMFKWVIITFPFWMPVIIVVSGISNGLSLIITAIRK